MIRLQPRIVLRAATFALLLVAGPAQGSAQTTPQTAPRSRLAALDRLYPALRREYSGERARQTVAFVEQFWRQPGSVGFDTTIAHLVHVLEAAGYDRGDGIVAPGPLSYRVERRPMAQPSWAPLDASLEIEGGPTLLRFATNRNMLAINSFATPDSGVVAEVVDVGPGGPDDFAGQEVRGRIVMAETSVGRVWTEAVQKRGALGVLAYSLPSYTRPEINRTSIQFGGIPYDSTRASWGLLLSHAAREQLKRALAAGPVRVRVRSRVEMRPAQELTLVAEIRGHTAPDERFVFSAHVQEPGANDNASGVGAQAEMARTLAAFVRRGQVRLGRTVTFIWGDEIRASARFLQEDSLRRAGVKWGMSLDMVGEDTRRTGGTFLIEKMPDPSAVWTRGDDRHSEWGGSPLTVAQLTPHYFNDFVLNRCRDQARVTKWVVRTNPYEGGSDHTPFLDAKIPGLLLWHFTDQFYHTDNDRLPNVSAAEMENVGVCALATAITLAAADAATARFIVAETRAAALDRLAKEYALGVKAVTKGGDRAHEAEILTTWAGWYGDAIRAVAGVVPGKPAAALQAAIERAAGEVERRGSTLAGRLPGGAVRGSAAQ
jgi:aminopeptidase YwaD